MLQGDNTIVLAANVRNSKVLDALLAHGGDTAAEVLRREVSTFSAKFTIACSTCYYNILGGWHSKTPD